MRGRIIILAATTLVAVAEPASAGDPTAAVSAPALTTDALGGSIGGNGIGLAGAALAVPVTHDVGFQFDGALGQRDDTGRGGLGAHLFTRDPDAYLVGATAMWLRSGAQNVFRYGVEAQAYLGDFTISPSAGLQRGDANKGGSTSGYGLLEVDYYLTPNIKLGALGTGYTDRRAAAVVAEWQPTEAPFSLFADAGANIAGDHHGIVLAGLRYTFGASGSSLKDRHRHGDPDNLPENADLFLPGVRQLNAGDPPAGDPPAHAGPGNNNNCQINPFAPNC